MDIYALIRKDHEEAKAGLAKIKSLSEGRHDERLKLFVPLKESLIAHNESEEESFYVALKQHGKTRRDAEHSQQEHHEAAEMLEDLEDEDMDPAEWTEKFSELYDALLHHISKEETKIFSEAYTVLSEETAQKLVGIMQDLKKRKTILLKKAS